MEIKTLGSLVVAYMSAHTWIPVDAALPANNEYVLIHIKGRPVWIGYREDAVWSFADGEEVVGKVTHWTLLPSPPDLA